MNDLPEELITEILLKLFLQDQVQSMRISKVFMKLVTRMYYPFSVSVFNIRMHPEVHYPSCIFFEKSD
jgi:hypothetical protein